MAEYRPYKPATGKEARGFEKLFCENCAKHAGDGCWVLLAAASYDPTDAEYPQAWRYGESGPECTDFTPKMWRVE